MNIEEDKTEIPSKDYIRGLYKECIDIGKSLFDDIYIKEKLTVYPEVKIQSMVNSDLFKKFLLLSNELSNILQLQEWPKVNNTLTSAVFIWDFMKNIPNYYEKYDWLNK